MLRRRKKQQEEDRSKKKNLERDRLEKAEEAYLERLANSIRDGNLYVKRPKSPPAVLEPGSVEDIANSKLERSPAPASSPKAPNALDQRIQGDPPTSPRPSPPVQGLESIPQSTLNRVIKPSPPSSAQVHAHAQEPPVRPPTPPPAAVPAVVGQPPPASGQPAPAGVDQRIRPASEEPLGTFPRGTVLQLEDGTIAVYRDPVKGKEYEIVYSLRGNGKAVPEGIALYAYEAKKIGCLPEDLMEDLQKTLRWDRDAVCFHLDKYEYCSLIPLVERPAGAGAGGPEGGKPKVMPDPPTSPLVDPARELVKGRRIYISFGPGKTWEAVYWGKDLLGHVVAHRTHHEWALMHLDIKRFRESIEVGEILKEDDIKTIQRDIVCTQ